MGEIYLLGNWELVHLLLGQFLIQLGPIPSMDTAALILAGNRITSPQSGQSSLLYSPEVPLPSPQAVTDQHSFS